MDPKLKGCLRALTLELRRELEGSHDPSGVWQPGDLERRLAAIGVRRDRTPVPTDELSHLTPEDREARRVVDAFLGSREEAGLNNASAVAEFVREAAYSWANRLLALRCMEARGLIDEVIFQKSVYGGRSLQHHRLAKKTPERCAGEDEGLFAVLFEEFGQRAKELPLVFSPSAPEVALRPSVASIKRCIEMLSGGSAPRGESPATDEVFVAPDALGWAYQYWNTEEKDLVFEKVRTRKAAKIEGAEIIPATCFYTDPYMVKFLVQNSLGATWMEMNPDSRLCEGWEYYIRDADRTSVSKKPVSEITFLDPACGSGHFLIEAFEIFYAMYIEEGAITEPRKICAAILERNLYGIDIDERAIQFAALALVMKAKERAPDFIPRGVNMVATNIRLPAGKHHLEAFLRKHPEDQPLKPALLAIFEGLAHADELGSLLQIEEPVEKELRHIEETLRGQLTFDGPRTDQDWRAWKTKTIDRLRDHFDAENKASDLTSIFFGEAVGKGLSLLDLLARRYDVVAANPPYMGSKNMGAVVKRYVKHRLEAGKRDLYAAFILRCRELAADGGRVAMVTQQSWMFLNSYRDLRALDAERRRKFPRAFGGVLRETAVEALAHLGRYAFSEIGNAAVAPAMFVFRKGAPPPEHRIWACRLAAPRPSDQQALLLRGAAASVNSPLVFRPTQLRFLSVPESPICYWLRERFFDLLAGRTVADVASVCQGLATADDPRFVRFTWEAPPEGWALPVAQRRWVPFEKGGGYGKWFGHHFWTVEWEHHGARIKQTPGPRVQNEQHYFKEGWTYSFMAQGSVGFRRYPAGTIFAAGASAGVIGMSNEFAAAANCRFSSYVVRSISAKIQLNESYVSRIPLPEQGPDSSRLFESVCAVLKRLLVARDVGERTFAVHHPAASSLAEAYRVSATEGDSIAAVLHVLEGLSERAVLTAYGVTGSDLSTLLDETGTPAGWFPLVAGCSATPDLPRGIEAPATLLAPLTEEPQRTLPSDQRSEIKRRLREVYEAGPGAEVAEDDAAASTSEDDEDETDSAVSAARILIPTETFLEELSQKLEIHPISVYWLLRELREKDGVVCKPELARFVEGYTSVIVLRLLGHRWPLQVETADSLADWADRDGIIPTTEGTGEPTLLVRVRERLAADFGANRVSAVEREFQDIVGRSLSEWLTADFFKRHVSQFRKRPIAWQIESTPGGNGKHQSRRAARKAPAFSCLVYYHRLNADLLPKLRTQYVGPLRTSSQTELASLEKLKNRSADQDTRRLELEERLDELKAFDARLEHVIIEGFASTGLDAVAAKEPLDKWTSRDDHAPAPASQDAFLSQERRYAPDLNDGVRVNIAPLQRAGLLAVDVLAGKDIEKPIADRAEWRADERRWCREGKLARAGWWPEDSSGAKPSTARHGDVKLPATEERT